MLEPSQDQILVLAPGGRDARVICDMLRSGGIAAEVDATGERLLEAVRSGGAAGAVLSQDALMQLDLVELRGAIERQPFWSDFPFVLLCRRGETSRRGSRWVEDLANVTIHEIPLHPASLVSAARSAIRARARQRLAQTYLNHRRSAEEEVRQLAATLEHKVADRTRELANANDRLTAEIAERERAEARLLQSQKMEALGQLTGGVAHDFNNLLAAVMGSLELLMRRTDDDRLLRLAQNAMHAAGRGAQLTSQLLAFARHHHLAPVVVDPNEIIINMREMLARTLGSHVRLETRLEPQLWRVAVDPTQFEVMVLNLAINARDAMPDGGSLVIETANLDEASELLPADLPTGTYVAIRVRDSGKGIPQALLEKVFEPFFTTKESGKGTGLGLSQVYGFARQSGGAVCIDSAPGAGAEIAIFLPRVDAAVAAEFDAAVAPIKHRFARVLLVDDDDDVRSMALEMLQELGYEVVAVNVATAALEALRKETFDLLLTDVAMPGMNGVELVRLASEIAPATPVLFATGYADTKSLGSALADADVVAKPFRMSELASRVAEALNRARTTVTRRFELDDGRSAQLSVETP